MALDFLRKMSGNEIKIFFIIMNHSDKKFEFGTMEKLLEFDLSYPTVLKTVDLLEKRMFIKKLYTTAPGAACILRVAEEFHQLANYLKRCPNQLMLFPEEPESEKSKKWWTKKDQDEVIQHYALELGVEKEKLKAWRRMNYIKNVRAAQMLLEYCENLNQAKATITNCKLERSKDQLNWSLGGDVTRNIQEFAPRSGSVGKEKKWH